MIQNRIQITETPSGAPASREMRFSVSHSVSLCAGFEAADYQPKLGGFDRTNKKT
ncbi:MAG: hypothetical protein M3T96_01560 [Acidobacteriota bacterium]|nr:hypothetical protein [Acidobacteriota bacterium]